LRNEGRWFIPSGGDVSSASAPSRPNRPTSKQTLLAILKWARREGRDYANSAHDTESNPKCAVEHRVMCGKDGQTALAPSGRDGHTSSCMSVIV
jgi:hypothetical protein